MCVSQWQKERLVNSNLQSVGWFLLAKQWKACEEMSVKVMDFENGSREPSNPNVA